MNNPQQLSAQFQAGQDVMGGESVPVCVKPSFIAQLRKAEQ